jgi:uncharacterized membrane protein YdbT with pleckstrin-like domain
MNQPQNNQYPDVVLWTGKPLFKPYITDYILSTLSGLQLFLVFLTITLGGAILQHEKYNWAAIVTFSVFIGVIYFIQTVLRIIGYRNVKYWITKDAVYIQKGVISAEVVSVHKKNMIRIDITKSRLEEKLGAGTIVIDDGETKEDDGKEVRVYKNLFAIKDPEAAVRLL